MFLRRIPVKLKPVMSVIDKEFIYHTILEKPDTGPWSVTDLINKGFALLACDRYKNKYVAIETLQEAKRNDVFKQYTDIIDSGLQQAQTSTLTEQYAFHLTKYHVVTKEEIAENIKVLEEASKIGYYY